MDDNTGTGISTTSFGIGTAYQMWLAKANLVQSIAVWNGRLLSSKDILVDLARRGFWQLGYEVNFLRLREVRQMITSVIAKQIAEAACPQAVFFNLSIQRREARRLQLQVAVTNRRSGRYGNTSGVSPSRSFRCTLRQKSG